jgi:hypothetical protein
MKQTALLVSINAGGIAILSDETRWRIKPDDLDVAATWPPGTVIEVVPSEHGIYKHPLINVASSYLVHALSIVKLPWQS